MNQRRNERGTLSIIWNHIYITLQVHNSAKIAYSITHSRIIHWSTHQATIK